MADERERELNRFWNEVVRGGPLSGEFDLDPMEMETIQRFHAGGVTPVPVSDRERAWQRILMRLDAQRTSNEGTMQKASVRQIPRSWAANGRAALWVPRGPVANRPARLRRIVLVCLAAALLVVVLLGSGYGAWQWRSGPADHLGAVIQAPTVGTPVPTPDANGNITTVLVRTVVDELPKWLFLKGLAYSSREPGGIGGPSTYGGPIAHLVISGTMTITSDHPTIVARGPAGTNAETPEIVPAGVDVVLQVGDTAIIPYGAKATERNDGPVPYIYIAGVAEGPEDVTVVGTGFDMGGFPYLESGELPTAPAVVTFSHVTMTPGARFGAFAGPGWQIYGAEDTQWNQVRAQEDGSVINAGETPIEVYVYSIVPLPGVAGTPSSVPATPAP